MRAVPRLATFLFFQLSDEDGSTARACQDGNKRLVAGGDMGVATAHKSQCHLSRRPSPRRRCLLPVSGEGLRAAASGAWTYHSARRCGPGNFSCMGGESAGVFFLGLV